MNLKLLTILLLSGLFTSGINRAAEPTVGPFFPFCIDWHDAKKRSFEQQAVMLKELGYPGVGHIYLEKVEERIRSLDTAGLRLFQITMNVEIGPDKEPYDAARFRQVLSLIKGRGVQFCLLINGRKPSEPAFDPMAVGVLRRMSDLAMDSGAQLLLYPHLGSWIERIEDGVRVAGKVNRSNVGVMFNLCHWLRVDQNRDYRPLLQKALPRLWAVSINGADDFDPQPGWNRYIQPLGEGSFDVAGLLRTLIELGYQGPIGLQCYGIGGDARDHLAASMQAWEKLRGNLRVPAPAGSSPARLPKIRVASDGRTFATVDGGPFVPFGVNYYRPGTGWAPQVWKKFDPAATRADFARMKDLGINCVRVFLSYGSFCMEPGVLQEYGLAKFDQFLTIAEAAGIYVHPTGLDHWEGTAPFAEVDRIADERNLAALESFWKQFAARYRERSVLFAYDLRNEPEVLWDTAPLRVRWNRWLEQHYGTTEAMRQTWGTTNTGIRLGVVPPPEGKPAPGNRLWLDYQHFREDVADEWTRRQVAAIKAADPAALVTVGLIQWSVPSLLPRLQHYSGFRPERQAKFLDFLSVHFYPLAEGAYEYGGTEAEARNLAYVESVVREVARPGKPVLLAEFGWYGGGKPTFDHGKHPAATGEQQAQWCRRTVETTAGLAVGWLNWGLFDQPEATDVSQLTGLLTADGQLKPWGREFQILGARYQGKVIPPKQTAGRPALDWDACLTDLQAGARVREAYRRMDPPDTR